MKRILSFVIFLSAIFLFSFAFQISAQVVETKEGTVEFIGLEKWTIKEIENLMKEKAPGKPLGQCAAVLSEIGFPSASVYKVGVIDGKDYNVVTVVEPQRADLVREKPDFPDKLSDSEKWQDGINILKKNKIAFQYGLNLYQLHLKNDTEKLNKLLPKNQIDIAVVQDFWKFLESQRTDENLQLAVWTLNNDGNKYNRILAAAVLSNFQNNDLTWWTLLDAQRDPLDPVSATASQVLEGFGAYQSRKINWVPAQNSLRYLLNGTKVFLYIPTLKMLINTKISPELGRLIAKDGSYLLLAYLKANYKPHAETARNFLVQISGRDFGYDAEKWAEWLKTLQKQQSI